MPIHDSATSTFILELAKSAGNAGFLKALRELTVKISESPEGLTGLSLLAGLAGGPLVWGSVLFGGCVLQCRKQNCDAKKTKQMLQGFGNRLIKIQEAVNEDKDYVGLLNELLAQNIELMDRLKKAEASTDVPDEDSKSKAMQTVVVDILNEVGIAPETLAVFMRDCEIYFTHFESALTRIEVGVEEANSGIRQTNTSVDQLLNDPQLSISLKNFDSYFQSKPIGELRHEPLWHSELVNFDIPTLTYGPPRVGKTCWILRKAIAWYENGARSTEHPISREVLYFDATHREPTELYYWANRCSDVDELLVLIDDIHFHSSEERKEWAGTLGNVMKGRLDQSKSTLISWISRNNDDISSLIINIGEIRMKPKSFEYPIERVVDMYMSPGAGNRLARSQMFIAALISRLDPEFPRHLKTLDKFDESEAKSSLTRQDWAWIERVVSRVEEKSADDWLKWSVPKDLKDVYLAMLPLASLDMPVSRKFYNHAISSKFSTIADELVKSGIAYQDVQHRIGLPEHPFQIYRTIQFARGRQQLELPGLRALFGTPFCNRDFAAPIFVAYFLLNEYGGISDDIKEMEEKLGQLKEYAEWSGVRDILADALDIMTTDEVYTVHLPDDFEDRAKFASLKLRRLATPTHDVLQKQEIIWVDWLNSCDESGMYEASTRRDYILYEIGYVQYLLGKTRRSEAIETLSASIAESVKFISKYLSGEHVVGSLEWERGAMAFANIWVTYLVYEIAVMEEAILLGQETESRLCEAARDWFRVYEAIRSGNSVPVEESAPYYLHALRLVFPKLNGEIEEGLRLQRPPMPDEADESPEAGRIRAVLKTLGTRELLLWCHSQEYAWWPWLHGMTDEYPMEPVPVPEGFSFTEAKVSKSLRLKLEVYTAWANSIESSARNDILEKAISAALIYRASGRIESLASYLLVVHRLAKNSEPELANAAAWAIANLTPQIGSSETAQEYLLRNDD